MKEKIDSNMRSVKFIGGKSERHPTFIYSIDSEKTLQVEEQLCHHCAKVESRTCPQAIQVYSMNMKLSMTVRVTACPMYMPVIGFREPIVGLIGSFTTFRAGKAWSERLPALRVVGLYNETKKELIGIATVRRTEVGKLSDMLEKYAHMNHSQKDLPIEGAPERVRERLSKLYGPRVAQIDKPFTVVFLERLD